MKSIIAIALALFVTAAHAEEWRPIYSGFTAGNRLSTDTSTSLTGSIGTGIDMVRVVCTTACYVAIAQTGSAALIATAATGAYLPAGIPEYFRARTGETVAVIGATAGFVTIHEVSK